jgi:phospholipid/cholesterol/gamma-HCH transport system substrate-binding protein
MEAKVNYTVVGAFVLVLVAAAIVAILWLSAGLDRVTYNPYRIYMDESVTGLSVSAPVRLNGVEVGAVSRIELNPSNLRQVKLLVNIKAGTPITVDTTATLDTMGITGIAYIALQSKGSNNHPLQIQPGEGYPVIKTAPSLFVRLDTALSQLTVNFKQISASIALVLDKDNQRNFKQALSNIEQLSGTLAINSQQLNGILRNSFQASQQFPLLLQNSQAAINNLNGVTNNLLAISSEIKKNPAVLMRGKAPQPLGPGEK